MAVNFRIKNEKEDTNCIVTKARLATQNCGRTREQSVPKSYRNTALRDKRERRKFEQNQTIITHPASRQIADKGICTKFEIEPDKVRRVATRFWDNIDSELCDNTESGNSSVVEYLKIYYQRRLRTSPKNTAKAYLTVLNKLQDYERALGCRISFKDINLRFYAHWREFVLAAGYSENYFSTLVKCLKVAYRDARDIDGLHNLHETEKRGFSSAQRTSTSIYLSNAELQLLADVEITEQSVLATFPELHRTIKFAPGFLARKVEELNIARNKFLLGAYTGLRVSDFNALRRVHIYDGFFRITTKKTGATVVIPIHPILRRIIESGFDLATPISDEKINKLIKEVARIAGITQIVEGTKIIDKRAVVGFYPKCEIITTHTARRSAATNMFKAGIPTLAIMKITGHTTEKAFMKYIKISAEENAEMLAQSAFFAG